MFNRSRPSMDEPAGTLTLRRVFEGAAAENRAALLPYMTAGLPDAASSLDIFVAMADAGADGFEVGIPYSDPLMDGPTIHEAGLKSLAVGTSLNAALDLVGRITAETAKPVIVMSYVNPVLRAGSSRFADRAAAAGASGVILADLPVDESGPFQEAFHSAGLGLVLFVAPTTGTNRLQAVADADPAFIYGIAEVGVTGERAKSGDRVAALAGAVRAVTEIPLVLGVGISTPQHARSAAAVADGVIVGSALVRRVLDSRGSECAAAAVGEAVGELAEAVRR